MDWMIPLEYAAISNGIIQKLINTQLVILLHA